MSGEVFEFTSTLLLHRSEAGWHFVTLPPDVADDIDAVVADRAGFGSVPVVVTVGETTWKTSLFPDKKAASFVLPIKKAVRDKEQLVVDEPVVVRLLHDVHRS